MNVIPLMLFVSVVLVAEALLLFAQSVKRKDHEHADRLSLLPILDDDDAPSAQDPRP